MRHDADPADAPADPKAAARSELVQACAWLALGIAALVGSLRMDRLESQNINPYTVPGLLPGLLGGVMILLGTLLALRSWRRGALAAGSDRRPIDLAVVRRVALVLGLCVAFGVVLVGHGLPFW